MSSGRIGRRPGSPDTRAEILTAARGVFVAEGYVGASVRGIAREAGVDPALIHRWFGGKEGLFLAVLQFEFNPDVVWDEIVKVGPAAMAARALTVVTGVWESPIGQAAVSAVKEYPGLVSAVAGFMAPRISKLLMTVTSMSQKEADLRGATISAQYSGLVMVRYVGAVEPLASMSREELTRVYAPIVHHVMFDPVFGGKKKSPLPNTNTANR